MKWDRRTRKRLSLIGVAVLVSICCFLLWSFYKPYIRQFFHWPCPLEIQDFNDLEDFCERLYQVDTADTNNPGSRIWMLLDQNVRSVIKGKQGRRFEKSEQRTIINALNDILMRRGFFAESYFKNVDGIEEIAKQLNNHDLYLSDSGIPRINRLLVEKCFPNILNSNDRLHISDTWIFVAFISVTLAYIGVIYAFYQGHKLKQTSTVLNKIEGLIEETFGLKEYVRKASQIYKEPNTKRVVTSLGHWLSSPEYEEIIAPALSQCKAEEIIFVGNISWPSIYFPGVIWRFNTALETLLQNVRIKIFNVESDVPLFVVSTPKDPSKTPSGKGNLLVGNPMPTSSTKLYGIDLGAGHPKQVDHYNFLFDTLIAPSRSTWDALKSIYENMGVVPYEHTDGLSKIFELLPFKIVPNGENYKEVGLVYMSYEIDDERKAQNKLIYEAANLIADDVQRRIENCTEEEKGLVSGKKRTLEIANKFLLNLIKQKVLKVVVRKEANSKMVVQFKLNDKFTKKTGPPNCDDFFPQNQKESDLDAQE